MKKIGLISLLCLAFAFSAIAQKSDKKLEKDFDKMENEMDKAFEMMKESMGTFQSLIQDLEMPDMKNFEFDGDLEMPEGKLDMNELFGFLEQSMGELNKMDWSGFNKMFEQLAESMQEVAPNFEVNPNQMKDKKDRKSKKF
jgi:hypothetical protein